MRIPSNHRRDRHAADATVTYDIETIVDEEPTDGSFPPVHKHRPVAAAFLRQVWKPGHVYEFTLDVPVCLPGEEDAFYDEVNHCLRSAVGIGWNSKGFDNPFLRNQAWRYQKFEARSLARQCQAERYGSDHLDLADQMSGYGGTRTQSLSAVCEVLEIPVKMLGHGSHVGDLWRAGDIETVKKYVTEDVLATYLVSLHWFAWRDGDPALLALPLADLAVWLEEAEGLEHLAAFATCRPARWARRQAPAMRAKIAADEAERRHQREQDEADFSF